MVKTAEEINGPGETQRAARVLHAAVSVLLDEKLPGRFEHPDIQAGFKLLAERVVESIDQVREEELALLREIAIVLVKDHPQDEPFQKLVDQWSEQFGPKK